MWQGCLEPTSSSGFSLRVKKRCSRAHCWEQNKRKTEDLRSVTKAGYPSFCRLKKIKFFFLVVSKIQFLTSSFNL